MSLCLISFTENGIKTSIRIKEALADKDILLYTKWSDYREDSVIKVSESIMDFATNMMKEKHSLVFIGACGIAVRAIAPAINSKLTDSPVLVIDEEGKFVIPILSGHIGGANRLASTIADAIGGQAVITTATDINKAFAVDLWAKDHGLYIANKEGIAMVSSKVLEGKDITIGIDCKNQYPPERILDKANLPDNVHMVILSDNQTVDALVTNREDLSEYVASLYLKPKEYVLGIGCKKQKDPEELEAFIDEIIKSQDIKPEDIYAIASIDIKKDEEAIVSYSRRRNIPFVTFSADELNRVEGEFSSSAFVKDTTGVDNVCERAAIKASEGELILPKQVRDGMTIAIARRDWRKGLIYE